MGRFGSTVGRLDNSGAGITLVGELSSPGSIVDILRVKSDKEAEDGEEHDSVSSQH